MNSIEQKIIQRRKQILVHSIIYYRMDDNIISDQIYDEWSKELKHLQDQHPEVKGFLYEEFKDWDGGSGYKLPQYSWAVAKAKWLVNYHSTLDTTTSTHIFRYK